MSDDRNVAAPALWKRRDLPGYESCRLRSHESGWELAGAAVLHHERSACRLDYVITCDRRWTTLSAFVTGWVGPRSIEVTIVRDPLGRWSLNGVDSAGLFGCVDVDLNFSPSTNLLPIRRLDLAIGQTATVRAAWLRFPGFELEPLEQTYTRIAEQTYRYESAGGRFTADLTVDAQGLVVDYGEIWSREEGA